MSAEVADLAKVRAQLDREVSEPLPAGFVDTDIANAVRFAVRHGQNVRFTTAGGWQVWDGKRWIEDEKDVRVQALAKDTALSIFDEIKALTPSSLAWLRSRR